MLPSMDVNCMFEIRKPFYDLDKLQLSSMRGTGSHVAGSSNRSSSTENWTRSTMRSRHGRVWEWCGCGCRPMLRWSVTETHPNKSFFGCSNYNVSEDCVQEELTKKAVPGDDDEVGTNFRKFGKREAVAELAPFIGSTAAEGVEGSDLLLEGNFAGLAAGLAVDSVNYTKDIQERKTQIHQPLPKNLNLF
ncbi:hypothetical protein Ahy_A03g010281 isoform A [Arachis hypogaea]|uniref:Zinc finger GRF-type domain-containing protein n=1 Tax=Arachis hypogaea TaxID=3818 RepID=A0A445DM88_ARAHY|nr:hypothetical protein Ahy_A03g010281 isoform A [Arachis hypogaea]